MVKKNYNRIRFDFNKKIELDFSGGEISSDTGLLLYREFEEKIGLMDIIKEKLHIKRPYRIHSNIECLRQEIFSYMAGYEDTNDADHIRRDPVMQKVVGKEALSSQPTMHRFENSLSEKNIPEFQEANLSLLDRAYQIEPQDAMILDLDSTNDEVYGNQKGAVYNGYYKMKMYHPLFAFEGERGDCLKGILRKGNVYTSAGTVEFVRPLIKRYKRRVTKLKVRGDSGFADPNVYKLCEEEEVEYFIRLKSNPNLQKLYNEHRSGFIRDEEDPNVSYGEFIYKASSWAHHRRVLVKGERKEGELFPALTFVVTNSKLSPKEGITFYLQRGTCENYIKEGKLGFRWDRLSCQDFYVNGCRLQMMIIAYNLNNLLRRLCFPKEFKSFHIETLRRKLIKLGSKAVKHSRRLLFRCATSFPYKEVFVQILEAIKNLFKGCDIRKPSPLLVVRWEGST